MCRIRFIGSLLGMERTIFSTNSAPQAAHPMKNRRSGLPSIWKIRGLSRKERKWTHRGLRSKGRRRRGVRIASTMMRPRNRKMNGSSSIWGKRCTGRSHRKLGMSWVSWVMWELVVWTPSRCSLSRRPRSLRLTSLHRQQSSPNTSSSRTSPPSRHPPLINLNPHQPRHQIKVLWIKLPFHRS